MQLYSRPSRATVECPLILISPIAQQPHLIWTFPDFPPYTTRPHAHLGSTAKRRDMKHGVDYERRERSRIRGPRGAKEIHKKEFSSFSRAGGKCHRCNAMSPLQLFRQKWHHPCIFPNYFNNCVYGCTLHNEVLCLHEPRKHDAQGRVV